MNRSRLVTILLAITMGAALPAATAAQDEALSPEGTDWRLSSYLAGGEVTAVPFGISASLLLEGGQASGSGGCNTFSGTYQLDGSSLTFSEEFATTLKLCAEDVQAVEDAYLSALPAVAGWSVAGDVLQLSDSFGATLLTFEVPSVSLTSSELLALAATLAAFRTEIDTLRRDMTRLNVDKLRERVKTLEAGSGELREQLDSLAESSAASSDGNGFTQAEGILLEGIPTRIASRCLPLRSALPKGAAAAVRCTPDTASVANLDYYLMEGADAAAAFQDAMLTFNVTEAVSDTETCEFGVKSQRVWIGRGWQSEGCYRTNDRAELRFVDNATDCRQLKVGEKRVKSPALLIALQGSAGDVAGVHGWATRNLADDSAQVTSISQPIERPGERLSPSCPT